MTYRSRRGRPLVFCGATCASRPVLTVENYPKWYGLVLVQPDGSVEDVSFGALQELADARGVSAYVDHVPNVELVPELARKMGWILDSVSYELMVGRWEAEVANPKKYDF